LVSQFRIRNCIYKTGDQVKGVCRRPILPRGGLIDLGTVSHVTRIALISLALASFLCNFSTVVVFNVTKGSLNRKKSVL
jgi:hypothetical protein